MTSDVQVKLTKLLERVKAATGPDRDIDADITVAMIGGEVSWPQSVGTMEPYPVHKSPSKMHVGGFGRGPVPAYTDSIDAALALVERMLPDTEDRNHTVTIWSGQRPAARIFYHQRDDRSESGWAVGALNQWEVRGQTPPLAILAALLTALSSIETGGK